jgi:hypothetical protein
MSGGGLAAGPTTISPRETAAQNAEYRGNAVSGANLPRSVMNPRSITDRAVSFFVPTLLLPGRDDHVLTATTQAA